MSKKQNSPGTIASTLICFIAFLGWMITAALSAQAQTYTILYSFLGGPNGTGPYADLIGDQEGNLYGITASGGTFAGGTVFKMNSDGMKTVLYSFGGISGDGNSPEAGLLRDQAGNLYGTTFYGGINEVGTVFKLDSHHKETVLITFNPLVDGSASFAALTHDTQGNLYGTTYSPGAVFKLDAAGNETVVYKFQGGLDGAYPMAGLVRDAAGNFYGTTSEGGSYGSGTVFKLDTGGNESILYSFTGGADGSLPTAALTLDPVGNLYGTTYFGGSYGDGVVFKFDVAGNETVLYSFKGGADGANPWAKVIRDPVGNLYGTTTYGGTVGEPGAGTVFKLDAAGNETVLHRFGGRPDGSDIRSGVLRDSAGNLYGTAYGGGLHDKGIVYKITSP
jgi:uncharacterized repeat protein (TIGR03803 family)